MTLAPVRATTATRTPTRARLTWLLCVAGMALVCLPIARAPVVADDLTVVARAIPILQEGSLQDLIVSRVEGNLNYQHYLPLAGVLEGLQAWLTIELARVTPLSVSNVWALARVFWVVLVLASAAGVAAAWRVVWPGLAGARSRAQDLYLLASVGFIGAATLQVHATWSLDPVISLNIYAWPSVALSLLYLAVVGKVLTSSRPRVALALAAAAIGTAAVLNYELSVGAAAGAGVAVLAVAALQLRLGAPVRRVVREVLVLTPAVLVPLLVLIGGLILRPASTDVYEGVQPRLGIHAIGTWATGLLGVVPGISWPRGLVAYGLPSLVSLSVAVAVLGLALLLVIVFSSRGWLPGRVDTQDGSSPPWTSLRAAWMVPFAALVTYWFVGTALHAITIKQQEEIDYTPGNVYLFYVIGFVVVTLAAQAVVTIAAQRWGRIALVVAAVPGLLVGTYQAAYNTQLTSSMRAGQNFNFGILASATETVPEAERCDAWAQFAAVELPVYFETWVAQAFDRYEDQYDQPFCTTDLTARATSGTSQREPVTPDSSFWWVTERQSTLRVARQPGTTAGTFAFRVRVEASPCGTPATVVLTGPVETVSVDVGAERPSAEADLTLPDGVLSADVQVTSDAEPCSVPGDPRRLLVKLLSPQVTAYRP